MPPLLRFLLNRLLSLPVTLLLVTALLYGFIMLTPPEERASLYLPSRSDRLTPEQVQNLIEQTIKSHHLRDPFPVQYGIWLTYLARGRWGYSPTLQGDVLALLLRRTPVTAELTLYSLLGFIPLGLLSGVLAGRRPGSRFDQRFRLAAFVATSLPPFILAIVLMAIFYVGLHWFPPERLGLEQAMKLSAGDIRLYTGLLTVDGLLNGRIDFSLDALRHLVLPVITLSLMHWATLGRITRAAMIEELQKDYIVAGMARGLPNQVIVWKHALRNALSPALTSSALSAASLFTGVFVVEVIFNFRGIADMILSVQNVPDAPAVLGFAIYSVIVVLLLMLLLDLLQVLSDQRIREGVMGR